MSLKKFNFNKSSFKRAVQEMKEIIATKDKGTDFLDKLDKLKEEIREGKFNK